MSITVDIYNFIARNNGVTRQEMLAAFPEVNRNSVITAYDRLYRDGRISRIQPAKSKRGFQYLVTPANAPAPEVIPEDKLRLMAIEQTARELESRGLYRRAATVWLQAYDCSQRHTERERYAKRRRSCLSGMASGVRDGSAAPVACYAEVPQ